MGAAPWDSTVEAVPRIDLHGNWIMIHPCIARPDPGEDGNDHVDELTQSHSNHGSGEGFSAVYAGVPDLGGEFDIYGDQYSRNLPPWTTPPLTRKTSLARFARFHGPHQQRVLLEVAHGPLFRRLGPFRPSRLTQRSPPGPAQRRMLGHVGDQDALFWLFS
jgi:hypothetical protein